MSHHWYESDWDKHVFKEKLRKEELEVKGVKGKMDELEESNKENPIQYGSSTAIEEKGAKDISGKSFVCVNKKETWEGFLPSGDKLIATKSLSSGKEIIQICLLPINSKDEFQMYIKDEDFQQFQNNLMAFYFQP